MNKKVLVQAFLLLGATVAAAAETVAPGSGGSMAAATFFGNTLVASGVGVGIAAGGCGIGMGLVIASALQGIARQPELQSKLQMNMFIGFALIEAQVLYALFLAIIFIFANPFAAKVIGG
ncbi:MAG: ATP synthase F0 subunit C [Chitinispirillaceae bacterium]|nr:ATP synthase F0 subunit C [Chitinispirillaceae bacterium]